MEGLNMSKRYDDETLIRYCLSGDEKAFAFLVHKYKDLVQAYTCQKVRNYNDAQDITQETFIRAYRNLGKLRQPHNFRSWLYTIASNECNRHLSRKIRYEQQRFGLEDANRAALESSADVSRTPTDWQIDLEEAMKSLPEDSRIAISMFYMSDCSIKEISEYLGVSINTVKSKLRRTRQKLGNMLESYGKTLSENRLKGGFIMQVMGQLHHIPQPTIPPAWRKILTRNTPLAIATSLCILLGVLGFLLGNAHETHLLPIEIAEEVWLMPPVGSSGAPLLASGTILKDDTQKSDRMLSEANSLLAGKKYSQAIDSYQKMLDQSLPDNLISEVYYGLGLSLYNSNKTDDAILALMQFSRKDKEWLTSQLILGRSYLRKAIYAAEDAQDLYKTAMEKLSLTLGGDSSSDQLQQAGYLYALCQIKLGMTDKSGSTKQLQAAQRDEQPEVQFAAADLLGVEFPGMRVVGSITQSENGQPIPGASIWVQRIGRDTTNSTGQFSIDNIGGHKDAALLWVDAKGYGRKMIQIMISNTEPKTQVNVEMRPGATVIGKVVNPEGKPIPDVEVSIIYDSFTMRRANTDQTGTYRLEDIEPRQSEQSLRVEHSDFISNYISISGDKSGIINAPDIKMERGIIIQGTVADENNNPVQNAFVTLAYASGQEGRDTTDEKGLFSIKSPVQDSAMVIVDSPQFSPAYTNIEIDPNGGQNTASFILKNGKILTGNVIDEDGNPIKDVEIRLQTFGNASYMWYNRHAITDTNGKFQMEQLPKDAVTISLVKEGYVYLDYYSIKMEANQPITAIQSPIVMQKPTHIYAKVLDEKTGAPIKNFVVKINRPNKIEPGDIDPGGMSYAWIKGYAFQSDTGEFKTFGDTRGKVVALQVEAKNYSPTYIPRAIFGKYDEEPLLIKLGKGTQLMGTVFDAESNKPVSGAFAKIFDKNHPLHISNYADNLYEDKNIESAISNEAGQFVLPNPLAEEFYLYVTHPEHTASIAGPLYASEIEDIRVDMRSGCTVKGTGEPKELIYLAMENRELPINIRLETLVSEDGIYHFNKVIPGIYNIYEMIEGKDFAASGRSMTIELESGQTKEINFHIEDKSLRIYGKVAEIDAMPLGDISVRINMHIREDQIQKFINLPKEKLQEYSFEHTRTAITDKDGNYEVFGLPPGNYKLIARKRLELSDTEFRAYIQKHGKVPQPQSEEIIFTIQEKPKQTEVNIAFSQKDTM